MRYQDDELSRDNNPGPRVGVGPYVVDRQQLAQLVRAARAAQRRAQAAGAGQQSAPAQALPASVLGPTDPFAAGVGPQPSTPAPYPDPAKAAAIQWLRQAQANPQATQAMNEQFSRLDPRQLAQLVMAARAAQQHAQAVGAGQQSPAQAPPATVLASTSPFAGGVGPQPSAPAPYPDPAKAAAIRELRQARANPQSTQAPGSAASFKNQVAPGPVPGGSNTIVDLGALTKARSRIPRAVAGAEMKPDLRTGTRDPKQSRQQLRATLGRLTQGMDQAAEPLGVSPDGSPIRDMTRWQKTPSRIPDQTLVGGLDKDSLYQLARTMTPGGASNPRGASAGPTNGSVVEPTDNISKYLPGIARALKLKQLDDPDMLSYALATIRAETSRFAPVSEGVRRGTEKDANTTPEGHPFDKYDYRTDIGNNGEGDGELYKGRGFIQLTGKGNYEHYGNAIGHPELVDNPDLANDPKIAGLLFAQYIKEHEQKIREAIQAGDLWEARRQVNGPKKKQSQGGAQPNGLDEFTTAFRAGRDFIASQRPRLNVPGMQPHPVPDFLMPGMGSPPKLGDPER